MKTIVGCMILLFVIPVVLLAHATGVSIEQEVNGYLIDIGYDAESVTAAAPVRFDFALYRAGGVASVSFSRVWVRIEREVQTLYAFGVVRPQFGATGALLTLPNQGDVPLLWIDLCDLLSDERAYCILLDRSGGPSHEG